MYLYHYKLRFRGQKATDGRKKRGRSSRTALPEKTILTLVANEIESECDVF